MKLVADASVIVKWFFPDSAAEADGDKAVELLRAVHDGRVELVQPPHWLAEVAAVIARLRPGLATQAIDLLDSMELRTIATADLYKHAVLLAVRLDRHLFDTLYHALAIEEQALLVTADEKYLRKARTLGSICGLDEWMLPDGAPAVANGG